MTIREMITIKNIIADFEGKSKEEIIDYLKDLKKDIDEAK